MLHGVAHEMPAPDSPGILTRCDPPSRVARQLIVDRQPPQRRQILPGLGQPPMMASRCLSGPACKVVLVLELAKGREVGAGADRRLAVGAAAPRSEQVADGRRDSGHDENPFARSVP